MSGWALPLADPDPAHTHHIVWDRAVRPKHTDLFGTLETLKDTGAPNAKKIQLSFPFFLSLPLSISVSHSLSLSDMGQMVTRC